MLECLIAESQEFHRGVLFPHWLDIEAIVPLEEPNFMESELGILDPSILQEYWGRDQLNAWIGNLSTVILTPNINSYV